MIKIGYETVEWGSVQIRFNAYLDSLKTQVSHTSGFRFQINR
jgi:hypothetical protein